MHLNQDLWLIPIYVDLVDVDTQMVTGSCEQRLYDRHTVDAVNGARDPIRSSSGASRRSSWMPPERCVNVSDTRLGGAID